MTLAEIARSLLNEGCSSSYSYKLEENLVAQRITNRSRVVIISDSEDENEAKKETYKFKNVISDAGALWDGSMKVWFFPYKEDTKAAVIAKVSQLLNTVNKANLIINKVEELDEWVGNSFTGLKDRLKEYIEKLAYITDEAALSKEINDYLNFQSKFHKYSFRNQMLIYMQKPNASRVASFNKWKEVNRIVKKGAKAIYIAVPIIPKDQKDRTEKPELGDTATNEPSLSRPVAFTWGRVFDISDTELMAGKTNPEIPQWYATDTPDVKADKLIEFLHKMCENEGIKVTDDTTGASSRGSAGEEGKHIKLKAGTIGIGRAATFVHEIAHTLLHFATNSKFFKYGKAGREVYAIGELQAESVAYIVMKHYDINVDHSQNYIAMWKGNKDKILQFQEGITKVARYIINEVDQIANPAKETEDPETEVK